MSLDARIGETFGSRRDRNVSRLPTMPCVAISHYAIMQLDANYASAGSYRPPSALLLSFNQIVNEPAVPSDAC